MRDILVPQSLLSQMGQLVCRYAEELDARVQSLEEEVKALRAENKALRREQ